jgi:hypothetical protein
MNQPWKDALDRLEALIALIRPGGCLCFTLKHCNVGRNTARVDEAVRLACAHLAPVFDRIQVQWLFSNSERERTILAFKRADHSA